MSKNVSAALVDETMKYNDVSLHVKEWNRATVADGKTLNDKNIKPLNQRDIYLADEITTRTSFVGTLNDRADNFINTDLKDVVPSGTNPETYKDNYPANTLQYAVPVVGQSPEIVAGRTTLLQMNAGEDVANQLLMTNKGVYWRSISGETKPAFKKLGEDSGQNTYSYTDLDYKPKINDIELDGNKTTYDLGILPSMPAEKDKYLHLKSDGNLEWAEVQVTTDFNDLENKPKINNVVLSGNKTTYDLGILPTIPEEKDKYLHLKTDGNLEWSTVQGGGTGGVQIQPINVEHYYDSSEENKWKRESVIATVLPGQTMLANVSVKGGGSRFEGVHGKIFIQTSVTDTSGYHDAPDCVSSIITLQKSPIHGDTQDQIYREYVWYSLSVAYKNTTTETKNLYLCAPLGWMLPVSYMHVHGVTIT